MCSFLVFLHPNTSTWGSQVLVVSRGFGAVSFWSGEQTESVSLLCNTAMPVAIIWSEEEG